MPLPTKRLVLVTVLAIASIAAIASMGGGFVALIVLVPIQWWAYRGSVLTLGRAWWLLIIVISAIELAWGATYVWITRSTPAIWMVPVFAGIVSIAVVITTARSTGRRVPSSRHA